MNVYKLLDALREKPEPTRRLVALVASSAFVLLLLIFWLRVVGPFIEVEKVPADISDDSIKNPLGAVKDIGENFANIIDSIGKNIEETRDSQPEEFPDDEISTP